MNCKQGSYLEFTLPWVVDDNGYVTQINGQLMHVDSSTGLQFSPLLDCETLQVTKQFNVDSILFVFEASAVKNYMRI